MFDTRSAADIRPPPRFRRPLIGVAIIFALGCAGAILPRWPTVTTVVCLSLASFAAIAVAVVVRWNAPASAALWIAIGCIGTLHGLLAKPYAAGLDWRPLAGHRMRVTVSGRIADAPIRIRRPSDVWRFHLALDALGVGAATPRPARGTLRVYLPADASAPPPHYGDAVRLAGVLAPSEASPFGLYLRADPTHSLRMAAGGRAWVRRSLAWRSAAADILGRGIEAWSRECSVIRAMLLGLREGLDEDLRQFFWQTGTMHIFAISGLHVGIVAFFLYRFVRMLGVGPRWTVLALAPLLAVYVAATGLAPSAIRAALMTALYAAAPLIGRRPDPPSALAAAALMILVADPTQIHHRGYLYSFAVVTGLFLLAPPLLRWSRAVSAADPWIAEPAAESQGLWRAGVRWLLTLLIISFIAWLVSTPLTARWGHLFAPIAIVANLLALPLAYMIVLTGMLALVASFLLPPVVEIFNHANAVFAGVLIRGIHLLSDLPGAQINVRAPPAWAIALYYAALVAGPHLRGKPRRALIAAVLAVVGAWGTHTALDRRITLHVLDAVRGGAVLIEGPRIGAVLFDPGSRFHVDSVGRYLRAQGINRLDAVIITRPESAAIGALVGQASGPANRSETGLDLLRSFRVQRIYHPSAPALSLAYDRALEHLRARGVELIPFGRGDRARLNSGAMLEGHHPVPAPKRRPAAEAAMAVQWSYGPHAIWVAGSVSPALCGALVDAESRPAASVLVLTMKRPEDAAATERLISTVRPRRVIVRGGAFPIASGESERAVIIHNLSDQKEIRLRLGPPPALGRCAGEVWITEVR